MTREDCLQADARDRLAPMRERFALAAPDAGGCVYLDGNSLGALPRQTSSRLRQVVEEEWGSGLIGSWNAAGWITLAGRVGDKIARVIGADAGEVIVADSTSINLHKALAAALYLANGGVSTRRRILTERSNFPSDLYIAETFARAHDCDVQSVDADDLSAALDASPTVLLLTHVNYRTGRMHDLRELTSAAHDAGAVTVWDLSHSAGALPVDVKVANADLAVGCGYKYLNGGPGAPAFIWVHPRHTARMDRDGWRQPLSGWLGHATPFAFAPTYMPAQGIARFTCSTPPILSLAALDCGVDVLLDADAYGGLTAIREKSVALADLFIACVETRCAGHELSLASPRSAALRGSQVCFSHPTGAYPIMQALIARGVIGDFRAPDILRFGFTPLYTRFVDVWDAAERLATVLETAEWRTLTLPAHAIVT
jgi:kynureninase